MITFLSPAKSLDFETKQQIGSASIPEFLDRAEIVNATLKRKSAKKLMELQSISAKLAALNRARNLSWEIKHHPGNAKQAVLAFTGDVYQGLEAVRWQESEMEYAAQHLRILSGLYGILKPTDLIQPYRLEMGTSIRVGRRANLYAFWKPTLAEYLSTFGDDEVFLNLASQEYFKAIHVAKPKNRVVEVEFLDFSNGKYKVISFFAKKARGLLANYIVQNNLNEPEALSSFDVEGYAFSKGDSEENKLVFTRQKNN
jgi:cytoplasmic iron level regulating protein YaaA (DUF328/UPF0246 family)